MGSLPQHYRFPTPPRAAALQGEVPATPAQHPDLTFTQWHPRRSCPKFRANSPLHGGCTASHSSGSRSGPGHGGQYTLNLRNPGTKVQRDPSATPRGHWPPASFCPGHGRLPCSATPDGPPPLSRSFLGPVRHAPRYGLSCVPSKFILWSPNPSDLRT